MIVSTTRACPLALVVDDETTNRLLTRETLELAGLRVEEAENGMQAIDLVRRIRPDIILLDVMMPQMDGFATCIALRGMPDGARIPILMMTGLDDEESIERAYEVGATDFVTKPWSSLIVSQRVRYMLRASNTLEDLHESETRLAQAQRIAQLGNWVWDVSRNVMDVSAEVYRILGINPQEFENTPEGYLARVHQRDREDVERGLNALIQDGSRFGVDHRIVRPDGTERVVHQQAERECDGTGNCARLVGTIQDVSEQKRREQALAEASRVMRWQNVELAKARDEALASAKLKDEFLATISHELLTPMNGLVGMTSLLGETDLSPEQREYVETIRESGDCLLDKIREVLDFSKMEADGLRLERATFDLRRTLEDALKPLAERAKKKGLAWSCQARADVPASVSGDPRRLVQILTKLVENAVKYTERGRISVEAMLEDTAGDELRLRFAVADTGIGIPQDARERLFKLFTQVDGSSTRKYGGIGLGLVISKKLAELMGGEVGVDSEPGAGSTFWFTARLTKA